jgi:hemerythrin
MSACSPNWEGKKCMLLQWSKEMAVGHPIIDNDHQMLVNIANNLAHAAQTGAKPEVVGAALSHLAKYVETHFRREEELFMDSHYPHKEKHLKNHQDIEQLLHGFQAVYAKDPGAVNMDELLSFLREWLIKHICKMDKGYASYVKAAEKKHAQFNTRTGFA